FNAGMFGMGLATTAAYGLAFLVSTTHFFKKKNTLRLQNPLPHMHVIFLILKTGLPESLTRLTGMLRSFIFNNLLLMVAGSAAVAALSMLTSVNSFVSSVSIGAGQALMLLVAIYFGEENLSGIKGTFKVALRYGVVLCCIVGVATFVFAESIVSLFGITPDNEAFALGVVAVRAFSLSIPVELVNCLFVGFFQSTGNIKAANLVTVGQSCVFMILFALCTVWFIGPFGVWYSYLFGTCATLAAQVVAACVLWRRRKVVPGDEKATLLDKMLLLPADFRKDWVDSKEFSCVTDRRGVVQCSEEVDAWCKSHDIDPRRTFQLSLAVEEMVGNILDHGFAKVKHPAVEVFMVLKRDGSMILRIRDNGKAFNPLNYDMAAKDDFSCLGIRMIRLSIEHLEYQGMVGLNNLNIELKKPQAL
ncbi:MAG: MATE family efflux transporter, partial [Hafnia sp.]